MNEWTSAPSPHDGALAVAQFLSQKVHLLKEVEQDWARSYCGLHEREAIWRRPERAPVCQACQRLARRERG